MRLIDGVKLFIAACRTHDEFIGLDELSELIDKMPTAEAIPMEWITQWLLKNCYDENGHYNGEGYDTVGDMLEDWRKENE